VDVFLFDEPLSNLDAKLRADLRVEIKRLHQQLANTIIYVTHDQVEAMTLADRIAIMKGGAIQQLGSPSEIYNRPTNRYVADFIGSPSMNFLEGVLEGGRFRVGDTAFDVSGYPFAGAASGPASMGIRPEHVVAGDLAGDQPVSAEIAVEIVEPMGSDTLIWTTFAGHPFRIRIDGQTEIHARDRLRVGFDPGRASFFDAKTELRL
jgi:multiple sugar transport system ATP-binding protein